MTSRSDTECERVVADLLALMSLPEKAGQIASCTFPHVADRDALERLHDDIAQGRVGIVENVPDFQQAEALQHHAYEHSRLGIPLLFPGSTGSGLETIMPAPLSLASSWDPALIAQAEAVVAREAVDSGCNWARTPPVELQIAGQPASARHLGADPYLAGRILAACMAGLQGGGTREATGLLASLDLSGIDDPVTMLRIVRLAMGGGKVGAIDYRSESSEDRAAFEVAFAFLMGPGGYDGMLPVKRAELVQGKDDELARPASDQMSASSIVEAVKSGDCEEANLNDAVARVLRAKFRLGLLKAPHAARAISLHSGLPTPVHNRETELALACRSAILLRNEPPLLPLGLASGDVLIVGRAAADRHNALGGRKGVAASVIDGFEQLGIPHRYVQGLALRDDDANSGQLVEADQMAIGMACEAAKRAGTAIYVHDGGGEGALSEAEAALLSGLLAVKPALVMVTLGGVPIDPIVNGKRIPALLHAGQLGTMAGHAVAQLLSGESLPSGKLPIDLTEQEGEAGLPFGHGLTYTDFVLRDLTVEFDNACVRVFAQLRNLGDREGAETVQLYLNARNNAAPPAEQRKLVAFERCHLNPRETRTVSFVLGREEFGRYYPDGSYRISAGSYDLRVGQNGRDGLDAGIEINPSLARAMGTEPFAPELFAPARRA